MIEEEWQFLSRVFLFLLIIWEGADISFNIVWNSWVPSRVSFLAWEAMWGKVLTLDPLKRKDWRILNKCHMCKEKKKQLNTSSFIVWNKSFYGIWFMPCLEFSGWCILQWYVSFWVGMGSLLERKENRFKKLLLCAYSVWRKIEELLIILKKLINQLNNRLCLFCWNGLECL